MKTQLSTPLTFLYKVVLPALYLLCIVFVIAGWRGPRPEMEASGMKSHPGSPALTAAAVLGVGAILAWLTIPLKKVEMDDTALYVSNCWTEIQIPLSEIVGVRETSPYWFTIIVTLKSNSSCGREIVFRPRHRFYLSGLHPITRQLAEHAKQARREAAGCGQSDAHSKPPATAIRNNLTA
jgi:hypothetical protein